MACEIVNLGVAYYPFNMPSQDTENEDYAAFRNVEAIIVPVGDLDEDSTFRKSTSLQVRKISILRRTAHLQDAQQNWLLGYEFPTTISVFLPDNTIIFIASNTKSWYTLPNHRPN